MQIFDFIKNNWDILFSGVGTGIVLAIIPKVGKYLNLVSTSWSNNSPIGKKWYGKVFQARDPEKCIATCTIDFNRFLLKGGRMEIHFPENLNNKETAQEFKIKGKSFGNRLFKFEYVNKNKRILQYGSLILKVSSGGDRLYGTFAGYGPISEEPVNGTLELYKRE